MTERATISWRVQIASRVALVAVTIGIVDVRAEPSPDRPSMGASIRRLPRGTVLELAQEHAGVEVLALPITFRFDEHGRLRWRHGEALRPHPAISGSPLLGPDLARQLAGPAAVADGPRMVVFAPASRQPRLAYWVRLAHELGSARTRELIVDAMDGRVLASDNEVRFDRLARVFLENPVATPTLSTVALQSLAVSSVELDGPDIVARGCIDQRSCTQEGDRWIHGCDPLPTALADETGDFLAYDRPESDTAPEDPFAELQLYFHATRALDAFRVFSADPDLELGTHPMLVLANVRAADLDDAASICDGPSNPAAPDLRPLDYAYYTPAGIWGTDVPSDMLVFGQGRSVDLAYDGDLVYHELTHAVVHAVSDIDWTVPDTYGMDLSQFAMNEGFADYFAAAITGDPDIGEYSEAAFAGPMRSLAEDVSCPWDLNGEPHDDSRLWSTALWQIRQGLAEPDRATMDASIFTVLASLGSWDTFDSAAALVVSELGVALGGAVANEAELAFRDRGLNGCNLRVLPLGLGERKESLYLWGTDRFDLDPIIPGAVQLQIELPEDASEIALHIERSAPIVTGPFDPPAAAPDLKLLVKAGPRPIHWTWEPVGAHDAAIEADITLSSEPPRAGSASIAGPLPAGIYHLQLANAGAGWEVLGISVRVTPVSRTAPNVEATGSGCTCSAAGSRGSCTWLAALVLVLVNLRRH